MKSDHKPGWWSWEDIVRHADRLGVPNFQRGAVWGGANRIALLESLYEQSPCGSFVFWTPVDGGDRTRHGVALRMFGSSRDPIWLVDGQQRSRAMLQVFDQLLSTPTRDDGWWLVRQADLEGLRPASASSAPTTLESDDEESEGQDLRFWGVVLPAMRAFDRGENAYFGELSESRAVVRGSMFRRLQVRASVSVNSEGRESHGQPLPLGVVPLATLLAPNGVFHDPVLRAEASAALGTLRTDAPNIDTLDDLLPWGPQFITGYAFRLKTPDGFQVPLSWSDIRAMAGAGTVRMVARLSGLFEDTWQPLVFERFRDMYTGDRFAFGWLPSHDVSEAIDAYVRINRSGIRVRAEEQALALLSRARPDLLEDLRRYIDLLPDSRDSLGDSRNLLTHESDRQLGFAVWIRVVTRYTTLALLGRDGLRWLEVSAIDKESFRYYLNRVGPEEKEAVRKAWARPNYGTADELVRECAERATRALILIDSVLSSELYLDHRMARPSMRALMPMLDLLYRLPVDLFDELEADGSKEGFRAAVARLLHWTLLTPYLDQAEMERLIAACHGFGVEGLAPEGPRIAPWCREGSMWCSELRAALERYQESLRAIWVVKHKTAVGRGTVEPLDVESPPAAAALTRLAVRAFEAEVAESRSLQNPTVGWLYAIECRGNAREFDWQAQADGHARKVGIGKLPEMESLLAEPLRVTDGSGTLGLYPEKQHVIPFADARGLAGKGGTRATASPANAIGNLTWLSSRQNGLKALSDNWAVMDRERDSDNLAARGMFAPAKGGRTALDIYEELQAAVVSRQLDGEGDLFHAFCEARAAWMVEQMRGWLSEPLSDGAVAWLRA